MNNENDDSYDAFTKIYETDNGIMAKEVEHLTTVYSSEDAAAKIMAMGFVQDIIENQDETLGLRLVKGVKARHLVKCDMGEGAEFLVAVTAEILD